MDLGFFSAILAVALGLSAALVTTTQEPRHLDITSRILEVNKDISQTLMEGDVAVPRKRNAMRCWGGSDFCKWFKSFNGLVEVPYSISNYFYDSEKATIEDAMETFHRNTCVRFVPYTGQADYLSIESKRGCWSSLGRNGGRQTVSLSVYGCVHHGIVQHELLHALGFQHEHTRSDRDDYVRINRESISPAAIINFQRKNTNNLDTPYDYSSIMHYGKTAFSAPAGAETITPIPDSSVQIGQRVDMSDIDILRINRLYRCSS